jgi:O-antigen/teichoic acid export membrane protein
MGLLSIYFLKIIDLDLFIKGFILVYAFQLLILFAYVFKIDSPSLKVNYPAIKDNNLNEIIRFGLILMVSSVSSLGLKLIDVAFVGKYLSLEAVAIYSIAAFIPTIIEAPLNSVLKIASPKIAEAISVNNWEEVKRIYYSTSKYLMLGGGFLVVEIVFNIRSLFSLLPPIYMQGVGVVLIMCISAFINVATGVNNSIIINSPNYKYGTWFLLILLISSVIGNVFLIPVLGIEGAALTALLSNLIFNILNWAFLYRKYEMQPIKFYSVKILLVMGACCVASVLLPHFDSWIIDIIVRGMVILLVYLIGVFTFKIITQVELFSFFKR